MSAYSARLDLGDVDRGFAAMRRQAHALSPAMRQLKEPMRRDQKDHARAQMGPLGAWKPRSLKTIAELAKPSNRRLLKKPLGKLPTAVTYRSTGTSVVAESLVRWSSVHQDGGIAGQGGHKKAAFAAKRHGSVIPARPFLWVSEQLLAFADLVIKKVLLDAFGGR